ncbi:PREDICTED: WPP domain-associated protein-like [Camelina sativa]|uniref:WPP domain-associated protein-like n=1 Tax=Camelina sativa TaxID=90675 RepID=A0ABM0T302_CAMSA|nr:PREDICTED: WPP domain-associated protein-like [Camelina sativa]
MKDIMKEVEGKVKFSMADSTMMLLVQQAMDKAHEKIKTKHGLLLRLNAISIFYELAVLQLESCLSFVRQETDKLESNHVEVVRDLREIKDRLHHRLLETELAILEKDRQLLESSENQESLRNVLESKETELVHLQDLERKRFHNKIGDSIKEDEFSELKSSVDQQVMNLRQKLETEYDELRGETVDPSGVDIDVLKGTMDLAFNKMHHAIFLSELGPIEQSWRWSIERDSMSLLIKGFMNGLEEKMEKVMMVVRDYESGFKERVSSIRREVECLESQIEQIITNRSSSPRSCVATVSSLSSIDCEIVGVEKEPKEDEKEEEQEQDSSNFPVSKLIKSHESIIRRKSEELAPTKIESVKRQKSYNSSSSKQAVDDIVAGLDSLMSLNTKLLENMFDDSGGGRYDHEHEVVMDDNLDDVWMKMQKNRSVFSDNAIEEKEDAEMRLLILEDTYLTLLKGLITDENTNNRTAKEEEDEIKNWEKDYEILREDDEFKQELSWIVVTELLREASETVENHEKMEANNKRMIEVEGNRACLEISLLYDDFDSKIQEKLKMVTFRLQNLEIKIDSTIDCIAVLRRKESVYRTAFVLRSENLKKAETEVDLLGDQVDSLVKLLHQTLWTFHQHPLLLCNNSDILDISKMIKKELSCEDS